MMIPIIALLVLSSSFIHSVPLDPVSSMLGSAGISAAMMGGFSLYSANKQASEDRRMQMYLAKQGLQEAQNHYADKKDQADAMKMLAQKSTKSPLLAYQSQMVQARSQQEAQAQAEPQAQALTAPPSVAQAGESTITFYFGESCGMGPSVTAYLSDFSDTLADPLRDKVRSIIITNVKAGMELELYAGMEPTTAKAYSKFIAKNNLPRLQMCNLETSSKSENHLYVVKPGIAPGELIGHVNYLFVKTNQQ